MFHSRFFIGSRQTCCAAKWKYKIIRIRHTMKWALVFMNITDLKQPLTDCIICLRWHFNKLLSSDINFHQDPTWHEINEKVHCSLVMMCHGWEITQRRDAHSLYLTNRFQVAVRLFSNRSQRTSKCGKNKKVAHEAQPSVSLMFLPHFDILCDLLLNRRMAAWNLFVLYNKKLKKFHEGTQVASTVGTFSKC